MRLRIFLKILGKLSFALSKRTKLLWKNLFNFKIRIGIILLVTLFNIKKKLIPLLIWDFYGFLQNMHALSEHSAINFWDSMGFLMFLIPGLEILRFTLNIEEDWLMLLLILNSWLLLQISYKLLNMN